jgi:hypothetical protein
MLWPSVPLSEFRKVHQHNLSLGLSLFNDTSSTEYVIHHPMWDDLTDESENILSRVLVTYKTGFWIG